MYDGIGHELSSSPIIPTSHDSTTPPRRLDAWSAFDTGVPPDPPFSSETTQEWRFEKELARLLQQPAPGTPTTTTDGRPDRPSTHRDSAPAAHRRRTPTTPKPVRQTVTGAPVLDRLSYTMVVTIVVLVATISLLGAAVTLEPLRHAAATEHGLAARWWPVLVHGPWIVACLSILRSSLHHHRAAHSWIMSVTFAGLSMALAVADAPKNVHGVVVAALPAIAITACLHQLVRQITLTRPPRRTNRSPRRHIPL